MTALIAILFVWMGSRVIGYQGKRTRKQRHLSELCPHPPVGEGELCFEGQELNFNHADIHNLLIKRMGYYLLLSPALQRRFVRRVQLFMQDKKFIIKDERGKKEMPVLVSAAAVQLTFGLPSFRLPFYRYIRIYPTEYFVLHRFTILKGNVEDNVITVAWSHLLDGYDQPHDGKNVGLHEMSHALYIQKMMIEEGYAKRFAQGFQQLMNLCHVAHRQETQGHKDMYTPYAETNLQEFWAESVELFFEKPEALHEHYPEVYVNLMRLLQQDPRKTEAPLLRFRPSFKERLNLVKDVLTH
jgi:MtfA peptidase